MAALNFPSSPTLNQVYTANGWSWRWDGTTWVTNTLIVGPTGVTGVAGVTGATGIQGITGPTGVTGGVSPRSMYVFYPTTTDTKLIFFYTTSALTLTKISSVLPLGTTTPTVVYSVKYGSDISAAGTSVTASQITVTSVTTASSVTSFSSATITAGSFVWMDITTVTGNVPALSVTLEF